MLRAQWGSDELATQFVERVPVGGTSMINVAHVITDLGPGGAENMLLKLLAQTDRRRFSPRVYSLIDSVGSIRERIEALEIPVTGLGMARRLPNPLAVVRLARLLRAHDTDIVQTWMYHADLIGGIAARVTGRPMSLVWNIRQSNLDETLLGARTHALVRLCARMSPWLPDAAICCSSKAREAHIAIGYSESKLEVIPNGFDLGTFRPNREARDAIRRTLGIPDDVPLIGLVARFDPFKDHRTFIDAAALLLARWPNARFVLCGHGVSHDNLEFMRWIDAAQVRSACILLGERRDVERIFAAVDLATLSSVGEGFPNAIGEAMACGVPCVSTDVGDAADIIGDTGCIVPPRDPAALADAWHVLLARGRQYRDALGARARARIADRFSIGAVARTYEARYEMLAQPVRVGA